MKTFIIGFVIGAVLVLFTWNHFPQTLPKNQLVTKTVTQIDTAWYQMKTNPKQVGTFFNAVPNSVDTVEILKRYFASNTFKDSISDSSLVAVIRDSVVENRIVARDFTYRINRPTVIQTVEAKSTAFVDRSTVSVGVFATKTGYGAQLLLARPKVTYGVGYDLPNKSIALQLSWKLFKTRF